MFQRDKSTNMLRGSEPSPQALIRSVGDDWLKDQRRVNTMRGMACILLVLSHAANDFTAFTLHNIGAVHNINEALALLRMPMFSFISGIVYAYRPVSRNKTGVFLSKKVRRLAIPFVILTMLIISIKHFYPHATNPVSIFDIPYYLIHGYSHLWFLQSLLIIFIVIATVDPIFSNKKAGYGVIFGASILLFLLLSTDVQVFSFGGAVYLFPFFVLGAWTCVLSEGLGKSRAAVVLASGLATIAFILIIYLSEQAEPHRAIRIAISSLGLVFLYMIWPRIPIIGWIGAYSYSIYLFHSIFIAFGLRLPGSGASPAFLGLVVAIGLLGPIVVEMLIVRIAPIFSFVIGKRMEHGGFSNGMSRWLWSFPLGGPRRG